MSQSYIFSSSFRGRMHIITPYVLLCKCDCGAHFLCIERMKTSVYFTTRIVEATATGCILCERACLACAACKRMKYLDFIVSNEILKKRPQSVPAQTVSDRLIRTERAFSFAAYSDFYLCSCSLLGHSKSRQLVGVYVRVYLRRYSMTIFDEVKLKKLRSPVRCSYS